MNRALNKSPIRVMHIIESLRAGGKERQLVELLNGMATVDGITSDLVIMSEGIHYSRFNPDLIPTKYLIRRTQRDLTIFFRLDQIVRTQKPDIIHSWGSMCSVYAAPIAKLRGVSFVNGFIRDARANLTVLDKDYRRGQLTLPLSNVVLSNSRAGLGAYNIPARKGICIVNGFDIKRVERLANQREVRERIGVSTPNVVGMVATFSDLKDYKTFFEVAHHLTQQRSDVTFVAVGDGPLLREFRRRTSPNNPLIKLLGLRSDVEEVASTFTIGVLLTNATKHGEGISNTIMEYMALGKPVIATAGGGTPELVAHGQTGLLVQDGDASTVSKHIVDLISNPDWGARLGANGAQRIGAEFGLDRMVRAHLSLYEKLHFVNQNIAAIAHT